MRYLLISNANWSVNIELITIDGDKLDMLTVPKAVENSEYVVNIFERTDYGFERIRGDDYFTYGISKYDFDRIKEMILLAPSLDRFEKLAKLRV